MRNVSSTRRHNEPGTLAEAMLPLHTAPSGQSLHSLASLGDITMYQAKGLESSQFETLKYNEVVCTIL